MVYKVTDLLAKDKDNVQPLVVKVSEKNDIFDNEIKAMKDIDQCSTDSNMDFGKTPEVIAIGKVFNIEKELMAEKSKEEILSNEANYEVLSYVIMPRYGLNLEDLFKNRNYHFTNQQIYSLSI